MKRLIIILSVGLSATMLFGFLRRQTAVVRTSGSAARKEAGGATNELARLQAESTELHRIVAEQRSQQPHASKQFQLDPKLEDWLLAETNAEIPGNLVRALRTALGLPWSNSSDYVLVSKATLRDLTMPSVGHNDKLSDTLCAVLAITPEERQTVESAFARAHQDFVAWAKANVERQDATGETLARYTIPASGDLAQTLTNNLYSALNSALGPERTDLLENYAYNWLRHDAGFLGTVTNTLSVSRRSSGDGTSELYYELIRSENSIYGQTSESGQLRYQSVPPTFRDIFPGGWQELAQREGFVLPEFPAQPKSQ